MHLCMRTKYRKRRKKYEQVARSADCEYFSMARIAELWSHA